MSNVILKIGDVAPEFSSLNQNKKEIFLKDFLGKFVVLYFYPKDDTSGCTIEALDFSRLSDEFAKYKAVILGVSKDDCDSHMRFTKKRNLTINLIADPDTRINQLYGVWQNKQFMGKEFMGTVRTTFLIGIRGRILKIWETVKPEGHAQEVLEEIKKFKNI